MEKFFDYKGKRYWNQEGELLVSSTEEKKDAVELWKMCAPTMTCPLTEDEIEMIEGVFKRAETLLCTKKVVRYCDLCEEVEVFGEEDVCTTCQDRFDEITKEDFDKLNEIN